MTKLGVGIVSGLKAFVISGLSAVLVLTGLGFGAKSWKEIGLALLIAFISGGIKGIEKAYNFTPQI